MLAFKIQLKLLKYYQLNVPQVVKVKILFLQKISPVTNAMNYIINTDAAVCNQCHIVVAGPCGASFNYFIHFGSLDPYNLNGSI